MADSKRKQKKKKADNRSTKVVHVRQARMSTPIVVDGLTLRLFLKAVRDARLLHLAKGGSPSTFKLKRHDIPFWDALFGKGTQAPGFRLYMSTVNVSIVTTTAYNTVFKVELDSYLNYSDLANVFDEYRPLKGKLEFIPSQLSTSTTVSKSTGIAVVDYDDTAALGSTDAGAAYDTHKFFQFVSVTGIAKTTTWEFKFDWLPDEQWVTTATANTVFAAWKPWIDSTHGMTTTTVAQLSGWCDFQFRGMD